MGAVSLFNGGIKLQSLTDRHDGHAVGRQRLRLTIILSPAWDTLHIDLSPGVQSSDAGGVDKQLIALTTLYDLCIPP